MVTSIAPIMAMRRGRGSVKQRGNVWRTTPGSSSGSSGLPAATRRRSRQAGHDNAHEAAQAERRWPSVEELRAVLAQAVEDIRHPALSLSCFTPYSVDEDAVLDDDDIAPAVSPEEVCAARLRRATLAVAAVSVVERCLDDLAGLSFDDDGMPDPEEAGDSFVYEYFPPRHRRAYNEAFFRKVLVTAVKVSQDLADPHGGPAACTVEEILRSSIGREALVLCEESGLGIPCVHPDEILLEDVDFEFLYDKDMDGLESDPAHQAAIQVDLPDLADWFTPFNEDRIVHPYARTEPSGEHELHDLRRRFGELPAEARDGLESAKIDDPSPVASFEASSDVVALARTAAVGAETREWVADPHNAEESFAELVRLSTLSEGGGGWLTWEPFENADRVRTDGISSLTPHRHFPIGHDVPWVDVSLGVQLVAVPLSVVVSYRPDPDVRRRWNEAFSSLG
jgi:hypothetical protein